MLDNNNLLDRIHAKKTQSVKNKASAHIELVLVRKTSNLKNKQINYVIYVCIKIYNVNGK